MVYEKTCLVSLPVRKRIWIRQHEYKNTEDALYVTQGDCECNHNFTRENNDQKQSGR